MKERPIPFSGPMVRAIVSGHKTVTRRAISAKLTSQFDEPRGQTDVDAGYPFVECHNGFHPATMFCPYGQPGERLWVREAWAQVNVAQAPGESWVVYRDCDNRTDYGGPWKPSIQMRRRDSRILLEVTDIRVERLRDSDDMALLDELGDMLEDCDSVAGREFSRIESLQVAGAPLKMLPEMYGFKAWWDKTNGIGSFDANPWVWVVEFKRIEP